MLVRIVVMFSVVDFKLEVMFKVGCYKDMNDMLFICSVKVYVDGVLGSWGVVLIEEYVDCKNYYGLMFEI